MRKTRTNTEAGARRSRTLAGRALHGLLLGMLVGTLVFQPSVVGGGLFHDHHDHASEIYSSECATCIATPVPTPPNGTGDAAEALPTGNAGLDAEAAARLPGEPRYLVPPPRAPPHA